MKRLMVAAAAASLSLAPFSPASARLADTVPLMVRADSEAAVTLTFENEPLLAKPDDVQAEYVCADGLDAAGAP
ncbi:MAG: hypothetical protein PHX41_15680, partial [Kiritimatiellae bacterium]|nr:hypothetical protein [Kiritimatiellia bacterium]